MIQVNLTQFPRAIEALRNTARFFLGAVPPQRGRQSAPSTDADDLTAAADRMIALGREHLRLQRDLHLDFVRDAADSSASAVAEPDWLRATPQELAALPEAVAETAHVLQEIDAELSDLSQHEQVRLTALRRARERMELTRIAARIQAVEDARERVMESVDRVYQTAARSGRTLNLADERRLNRLRERLRSLNADEHWAHVTPARLGALTEELNRLARRRNRRELASGLLLTPSMREVIAKALPPLAQGRPVLLVGETGGAKTALAQTLARRASTADAELVSFHGEINTYQLIGRDRIEADGGMSFRPGPVLRAMSTGAPLILDEVNAAPAEFLKRLNVILQLRPGDSFLIQEDSESRVTVQEGFCVIATANEKSARYKGVDVLSAELKNRFGMNVHRISYPDSDVVVGELPPDGLALAEAALADELGEIAVPLPEGQLAALVKAAHATQKLFTGTYAQEPTDGVLRGYVPMESVVDGAHTPALDDSVLSPRTVVALLEQVRSGMGRVKLTELLRDWVSGLEKRGDRDVLLRLLDSFTSDDGVSLLGNPAWSSQPASV